VYRLTEVRAAAAHTEETAMIDHITLRVKDLPRGKAFYAAALAPLGYTVLMEFGSDAVGLGAGGKPDFWLAAGPPPPPMTHIAFAARDHAAVDGFHAAAIAAGATDNGKPGPRPDYGANYYAAFVLDPEGHNIEAVCHAPQGAKKAAKKATAATAKAGAKRRGKPAAKAVSARGAARKPKRALARKGKRSR
jgi:catechol 2,3-dioxygenase-like lactoylglutathione lyase family enzyme